MADTVRVGLIDQQNGWTIQNPRPYDVHADVTGMPPRKITVEGREFEKMIGARTEDHGHLFEWTGKTFGDVEFLAAEGG